MSMSMLGSINVQAIAGAIMTGTHGTGKFSRGVVVFFFVVFGGIKKQTTTWCG
jgi:hypothetical protein